MAMISLFDWCHHGLDSTYSDLKVTVKINETFQELDSVESIPNKYFRIFSCWLELDGICPCLGDSIAQEVTGGTAKVFLSYFEPDMMTRRSLPQQFLKPQISLKLAICRMSPWDWIEMDSENPRFHIRLRIALDFYIYGKSTCMQIFCHQTADYCVSIIVISIGHIS